MNQNLLIAALILFLAVGAAGANKAEKAGPETLFLTSQQRIVKVVPESDGSVWVLRAGSTLIERYAGPGVIAEGFDIAGLRISSLPLPWRRSVYDIDRDPTGALLVLVGAVNPETLEIQSCVVRILGEQVDVIPLRIPIAVHKFGMDGAGNFHVLGLLKKDLENIEAGISGSYKVVHRFSGEGDYLGSYLPLVLDASTKDKRTRNVASPLYHPGNFAVNSGGTLWVLWLDFPVPRADRPVGPPSGTLWRLDPQGRAELVQAKTPEPGFHLTGLVKDYDSGEVTFVWTGRPPQSLDQTVLTTAGGAVLGRSNQPGVLAFSKAEVFSSALMHGRNVMLVSARQ